MYVPASFGETDPDKLLDFVARYPFATVVTPAAGELCVSHLPLLARRRADRIVLVGHVARANKHWQAFDRGPTTAIFHGPHAYVSPSWYATALSVPTWNYAVVHATGQVRVDNDRAFVAAQLDELIETFEGNGTAPGAPASFPKTSRPRSSRRSSGSSWRSSGWKGNSSSARTAARRIAGV